jgi:hypothetical protein
MELYCERKWGSVAEKCTCSPQIATGTGLVPNPSCLSDKTAAKIQFSLFRPLNTTWYFTCHQAAHTEIPRCSHTLCYQWFLWISELKAIVSIYTINWLVFITQMECVYCRSKWQRGLRCGSVPDRLLGLRVRILSVAWMCFVVWRDLWGPITLPEET